MAWCIMNCVGTNFALNPVPTEVDLVFFSIEKPHVNQSLLFGFSNRGHNAEIQLSRIF